MTAIVEPSISNMGYITTVLPHDERLKAGLKNGAHACVSIALDPLGSVSVNIDSLPQGQGHNTVIKQVVSKVFSIDTDLIEVNSELDTQKDGWSIAAGNYSSRFAGAVAGTAHIAAQNILVKLKTIAAKNMNVKEEDIVLKTILYIPKITRIIKYHFLG